MAASFRTVRKNTIQIAEEIPEDQYSFVPAPGTRSIAHTLAHIAITPRVWRDIHGTKRLTSMAGYDFFGTIDKLHADEKQPRTKAEIIELLRSEGEEYAGWLESVSWEQLSEQVTDNQGKTKSRLEHLLSPKEHEMHHRGQLMLIERQLGITPHFTRQLKKWPARCEPAPPSRSTRIGVILPVEY